MKQKLSTKPKPPPFWLSCLPEHGNSDCSKWKGRVSRLHLGSIPRLHPPLAQPSFATDVMGGVCISLVFMGLSGKMQNLTDNV